jgi:hypothetical protein
MAIHLTPDAWSRIFLFSSPGALHQLSQVSKLFDSIFHERYPWQSYFGKAWRFTDTQVGVILKSASEKQYLQFLVTFIQSAHSKNRWTLSHELSEAGGQNNTVLTQAFFQSGCFEKADFYKCLNNAAHSGHVNIAQVFIHNGWDLEEGATNAVCAALKEKKTDFVKVFIETTPFSFLSMDIILMKAVKKKDVEVVKAILDQGYCQPTGIQEALIQAATEDAVEIMQFCIACDCCPEEAYNRALSAAAEHNQLESVRVLVEKCRFSLSGLGKGVVQASTNGHLEVVKYLIETGKCQQSAQGTALVVAARNHHLPVVLYFIQHDPEQSLIPAVQAAVDSGDLRVLQVLLATGRCVFLPEDLEQFARLAAEKGYLPILEAFDPPSFSDTTLMTALGGAVYHNQLAIVKGFIQKKWVKQIPFDFILHPITKGYHEMVELLLNTDSFHNLTEVECYSMFNQTSLFLHIPVLEVLLESPYFEVIAPSLQTLMKKNIHLILQVAAKEGRAKVINQLDSSWFTEIARHAALKTALRFNQHTVVKKLLDRGWIKTVTIQDLIAPLQKGCDESIQVVLNSPQTKDLSLDDFYFLLNYVTKQERLTILDTLLQSPRFMHLKHSQIQTLAFLAKSAINAQIHTTFVVSRRGYEFSRFLFVRMWGRLLSFARWLYSLVAQ